ncbi:hypothetical protein GobsT_18170 [Gemmata obscuriglobus]|uniref:Queuine tRNA-ribosyltransferase n=1 Tax=Gemmata obscuriglobus TaxID=114 RepID=A0A2Z3H8A8_9BACT|nr:hypothetical protein [Gemmata obscuriglobus]AWM39816.1 hypothetical protein C1280_24280 [Gemmata obscuriglobus]QEG27064.1 hypothetical protein GobsT_18170 [Gemmata obscuriglobus]VTS03485.1 Uncharacterized protein OS=Streptomyces viridochromogenes Tue57 GN=STVIR_3218 PE=4 SV=1 [Gemmata obscuriglobus UQM 2246]
MIRYLTGVRHPELDSVAAQDGEYGVRPPLGVLVQPLTAWYLRDASQFYDYCGIDNGCFTEAGRGRFTMAGYERLVKSGLEQFGPDLLFATAPDTPFDWSATLRSSLPTLQTIRRWQCPAALVWQDGATAENMPWDAFDVGFIGGSTEWKLGPYAKRLTAEARRRGKLVHMGRVNSTRRLLVAQRFGCDTADGTYLKHELAKGVDPAEAVGRMVEWLRVCFSTEQTEVRAELVRSCPMLADPERMKALRLAGLIW